MSIPDNLLDKKRKIMFKQCMSQKKPVQRKRDDFSGMVPSVLYPTLWDITKWGILVLAIVGVVYYFW